MKNDAAAGKKGLAAAHRGFRNGIDKQNFTPLWLDAKFGSSAASEELANMSWEPVYRMVKRIPRGRVTTYGELARVLRTPGGARAVGYALAACPSGRGIPWHRVVGAGGRIRVPEPHASLQRRLLDAEGVHTGSAIDMKRHAWPFAKKKRIPKRRAKRSTIR